jgi:hypothetical protein
MATSSRSQSGFRIFLSYRRADCPDEAGRLRQSLVSRFGPDQVFMDVHDIHPGRAYPDVLDAALAASAVLLALIGPGWLAGRRLGDPKDVVRRELEVGLRRRIVVIPVLLRGATMPTARVLPGPLKPIAGLQAARLSEQRWRADVRALAGELDRLLAARGEEHRLGLAGHRIDAQVEYNLAALRTREAAVGQVLHGSRQALAAADRQARMRLRGMEDSRRKLASASARGQDSLLRSLEQDNAALADRATADNDAFSRQVNDVLNGPGALAVAPQPLPEPPPGNRRRRSGGR